MPRTLFDRMGPLAAGAAAIGAATALAFWAVPAQAQQAQASGQVVRVDAAQGKIAIKHGAIRDLELPAMTLVYRVDPALIAGIQPGDTVDFTASRQDGQYVISKISK